MPRAYRYGISAACGGAVLLLVIVPESAWSSLPVLCVFRNVLGVECLGCGMTRALSAALHGHATRALELNAGVVLAGPALLAGVVQALLVRR